MAHNSHNPFIISELAIGNKKGFPMVQLGHSSIMLFDIEFSGEEFLDTLKVDPVTHFQYHKSIKSSCYLSSKLLVDSFRLFFMIV